MPPKHHRRERSWVNINHNTDWIDSPGVGSVYIGLIVLCWLLTCAFVEPFVALAYTVRPWQTFPPQ